MANLFGPRDGALTRAFVLLYFAAAAVTAFFFVWLILRVVSEASGIGDLHPPPVTPMIVSIFVMILSKFAAAWAWRRDSAASKGERRWPV